jgi:hypothetical protein
VETPIICSEPQANTPINYGDLVECEFDTKGDTDTFSFSGNAGELINLAIARTGATIAPCIYLYDPDGKNVGSGCNYTPSNAISYPTQQSGTYTIFTRERGNIQTGGYTLSLQCISQACIPLIRTDNELLGQISLNHNWQNIRLNNMPPLPVVILGLPTYYGGHPGTVRVRSVTGTGFEARFEEWDYRSRDFSDNYHALEKVPYLVLEEGHHLMNDGSIWEVGILSVNGTADWHTFSFAESFRERPYLFLTVQSDNDSSVISARSRSVDKDGFEVALFEEQALMDGHGTETVAYLAIFNPSRYGTLKLNGPSRPETPYYLHSVVADHNFTPAVSALVKVEEDKSVDSEVIHVRETIDVLSISNQVFAQQVSSNGSDTAALRRCAEACP